MNKLLKILVIVLGLTTIGLFFYSESPPPPELIGQSIDIGFSAKRVAVGENLFLAADDRRVTIFDRSTRKTSLNLTLDKSIRNIRFLEGDLGLVEADSLWQVWNFRTGALLLSREHSSDVQVVGNHSGSLSELIFHSGKSGWLIRRWNEKPEKMATLLDSSDGWKGFTIADDGSKMALWKPKQNTILVKNLNKPDSSTTIEEGKVFDAVQFSPRATRLTWREGRKTWVYNLLTGDSFTFSSATYRLSTPRNVLDEQILAFAGVTSIQVFDLASGSMTAEVSSLPSTVSALGVGHKTIVAAFDGLASITVWELK